MSTDEATGRPDLPPGASIRSLLIVAAVMEAAVLSLHFGPDRATQVAILLAGYAVSGAAYGWLLWQQHRANGQPNARGAGVVILAAAVIFRLTLLPLPPATSGDVYRYLWEGLVQSRGFDPYATPPNAPELAHLAAEYSSVWEAIERPHIAAIYPAFAQVLFHLNAILFGGTLLGWKIILLGFDALLTAAVWMAIRQRGSSVIGLAAVAWCPLLIFETYEGGHLDVIGAALVAMAIVGLGDRRWLFAAAVLGLAANVKQLWAPLAFVVLAPQARSLRRLPHFLVVTVAAATLVWWPYRDGIHAAWTTARMFAESWTFNDAIFELLRTAQHGLAPDCPWLPMVVVGLVLMVLALLLARRPLANPWPDVWLIVGTALLIGPVAYPWYFIWAVPGLAFRRPAWLVAWVLTLPVLHVVDLRYVATGQWNPLPWLWVAVSVVPAVLLVRAWRERLRSAALSTAEQAAPCQP